MDSSTVQNILLSILNSIITGGFILVFVEIGNRKNRENDRHDQIMRPFMHKLSSYFRFLSWCRSHLKYPKELNEKEKEFKRLFEELSRYGEKAIHSGGDYGIEDFSAKKLDDICFKINNIWYWRDRMHPCNISWDNKLTGSENYIAKELKEFFPNYLTLAKDINLISKVSGDFYTDIYLLIKDTTYLHEAYMGHFKRQLICVTIFAVFVLTILVTMLFVTLSIGVMQIAGILVVLSLVLCLLLLGVDIKTQIKYYYKFCNKIIEQRKSIVKILTKIGLSCRPSN